MPRPLEAQGRNFSDITDIIRYYMILLIIPGISCGYPYAVVWRLSHRYVVEVEMNALDASDFG